MPRDADGGEPVHWSGDASGYVISIGEPSAYAWLPSAAAGGGRAETENVRRRVVATGTTEALVDPGTERLRR